jgi:hypothetical protein
LRSHPLRQSLRLSRHSRDVRVCGGGGDGVWAAPSFHNVDVMAYFCFFSSCFLFFLSVLEKKASNQILRFSCWSLDKKENESHLGLGGNFEKILDWNQKKAQTFVLLLLLFRVTQLGREKKKDSHGTNEKEESKRCKMQRVIIHIAGQMERGDEQKVA